jgi:hypothetical protein
VHDGSNHECAGDCQSRVGNKSVKPYLCRHPRYAESEVVSKRESRSRPGQGIVTIKLIGHEQGGMPVITYPRIFLVPKKGHSQDYPIG